MEKEKQKLAQQAQGLEQKNKELSDSLLYLNSSGFKERVARQQLNLKKQGEVVYNFGQNTGGVNTQETDQGVNKSGNFQKWLEYFFGG